eukprot:EG_transcript_1429
MASDFSIVTTTSVDSFGGLIPLLIADSTHVVKCILDDELIANEKRINITEAQISATSLGLLEFTQNTTQASQTDLQDLVHGFHFFVHEVMGQFESMAVSSATQVRHEAAFEVEGALNRLFQERVLAIKRVSKLYNVGFMDVRRDPSKNISASDCKLLALMCDASDELDVKDYLFLQLASGAFIACKGDETAIIFSSISNGTHVIYGAFAWRAYSPDVPENDRQSWQERCLTQPPRYTLMAVCPLPPDCRCGYHPTCDSSYLAQMRASGPPTPWMIPPFVEPYYGLPMTALTFPVYNASAPPRELLAVSGAAFFFKRMKDFLGRLSGPYLTAVVLNDADLTTIADSLGNGTGNSSSHSSHNSFNLSILHNADAAFQSVGRWLLANRNNSTNHTEVVLDDILWDIFSSRAVTGCFFVLVGMQLNDIYGAIESSQAEAVRELQALKAAHTAKLMESQNRTRSQLESAKLANLQHLEVMKNQTARHLALFRHRSYSALNASQAAGRARLDGMMAAQRGAVGDTLALHLRILTGTIGWSIATVVAVFLATLLAGVYSTLTITKGLQQIIQLMEDVALMHVEALRVPRDSCVVEVHRIQLALDKLAGRLALYKGFMPAGLFPSAGNTAPQAERSAGLEEGAVPPDRANDRAGTFIAVSSKQVLPIESMDPTSPEQSMVSTTHTRIVRRRAVAMVVNIRAFQAVLYRPLTTEGHVRAVLSEYLALVHGLVAEEHGNIDAVIGDQVLVTFNAHFRCCDAPVVAARASLKLQTQLVAKLSVHLQLQIGLAEGWMHVGCAGYDPFKTMVALGSPLKVASLLAHLTTAAPDAVLTDPAMEERCRHAFRLRPVALVHFPHLGRFVPSLARGVPVHLLEGVRDLRPTDWLYDGSPGPPPDAWASVFNGLCAADSMADAAELLQTYVDRHPADGHAQLLKSHLQMWCPQAGVPLRERTDSFLEPPLVGPFAAPASQIRAPGAAHLPPADTTLLW